MLTSDIFFSSFHLNHMVTSLKAQKVTFSPEASLSRITRGAVKSYSRMSQIGYNCSFIEKAFLCVLNKNTAKLAVLVQSPIRRGTCTCKLDTDSILHKNNDPVLKLQAKKKTIKNFQNSLSSFFIPFSKSIKYSLFIEAGVNGAEIDLLTSALLSTWKQRGLIPTRSLNFFVLFFTKLIFISGGKETDTVVI